MMNTKMDKRTSQTNSDIQNDNLKENLKENTTLNSGTDEWLIKEMIQKLDVLLSYYWKHELRGKSLISNNFNENENNENIEISNEDSWFPFQMNILNSGDYKFNSIQYFYIRKVISFLLTESISIGDIEEEEETSFREAANQFQNNSSQLNNQDSNQQFTHTSPNDILVDKETTLIKGEKNLKVSIDTANEIWKQSDNKKLQREQQNVYRDLKLFLTIRKYLVHGLFQFENPPDRIQIESVLKKSYSINSKDKHNPDEDFEDHLHEILMNKIKKYNKIGSMISLQFIDIIHKYIMNLRYVGPSSLRLFLQTVVIPLLTRASKEDHVSMREAKITYIICTYILEIIPRFQFNVLSFITEYLIPILPEGVSFCVLEMIFQEIIFQKTPFIFLKEYIAKTIIVHKHLYIQQKDFLKLVSAIKAFDIDEERNQRKMDPYFDVNSIILTKNLFSNQEIDANSKENFILIYNILEQGKKKFEETNNIFTIIDATKLTIMLIKNKKISKCYNITFINQASGQELKLTSAESEYIIQDFVIWNLDLFIEHTLLQTFSQECLIKMIKNTLTLYLILCKKLSFLNIVIEYHEKFIMKLLDALFHEDTTVLDSKNLKLSKQRAKLGYLIFRNIFQNTPSIFLFISLCKRNTFRDSFIQPLTNYFHFLINSYIHHRDSKLFNDIFNRSLLSFIEFNLKAFKSSSTLIYNRNGKLNDSLELIIEVTCAVDACSDLVPISRQSLIYFYSQIEGYDSCHVSKENMKLLQNILSQ